MLARPTPQKNPKGTDITKAHGQAVTKNTKDLYKKSLKLAPNIVGITTIKTAKITTIGVYILENLVINFSVFVFLSLEFSSKLIILLAVEFSATLVAFTVITPLPFTNPLKTVSP